MHSDKPVPHNRILAAEAAALLEELPPIRHENSRRRSSGMLSRLLLWEKIFVCALCIVCAALGAIIYYML